jgi:hypothetical protein
VLVDPDPELLRAMTTALAPWRLEVVTDSNPVDAASAPARATAMSARFVVWRENGKLVVFDRERGDTVHRDGANGELDPVAAAAAALTVKTLMRLPPPPPDPETKPPVATGGEGTQIRVQAGLATRIAGGDVVGRFAGAALIRPLGLSGWRFGLLGDTNTDTTIENQGFKGSWSDWSLLALASYTIARGRIEVEPFVAAGVTRSRFEGEEMMTARDERDTLAAIRVGGWVRLRAGMWTVGATLELDASPGTPTYTRLNNSQEIFAVPSTGIVLGLVVAADLGR